MSSGYDGGFSYPCKRNSDGLPVNNNGLCDKQVGLVFLFCFSYVPFINQFIRWSCFVSVYEPKICYLSFPLLDPTRYKQMMTIWRVHGKR